MAKRTQQKNKTREVRFQTTEKIEVRESQNEHSVGVIRGYAAVYGSETDLGWFREVIKEGAFKRAIDENQDVRGLWNHDTSRILGRRSAGTLTITEDSKGLAFELELPDTTVGRDAKVSIERGDITGMSFGFQVREESWHISDNSEELDLRELEDLDLFEVSPVTFPAYQDTEVGMRSLDHFKTSNSHKPSNANRSSYEFYKSRAARRHR